MVSALAIQIAFSLQLLFAGGSASPMVVGQAVGQVTARDATERANARVQATDKQLGEKLASKRAIERKHAGQLKELDRLKKQRASWNRDRNIRSAKAEAHATSQKLAKVTQEIRRLRQLASSQRRDLVAAIDAELAGAMTTQRQVALISLRSRVVSQLPRKRDVRKIVIPDEALDELADPEELEEHAALLAQAEKQLVREQQMLAQREKRFEQMAKTARARRRATELEQLDSDDVRRNTGRVSDPATRGAGTSSSDDEAGSPSPSENEPPPDGDFGNFEESSVVLADVVDASTVDALRRAERSTNPRTKAAAARQAREQVEAKLEKLRAQRKKIQQRARGLRRQ